MRNSADGGIADDYGDASMKVKTSFALEIDADDLVDALARSRVLAEQVGGEALLVRRRDAGPASQYKVYLQVREALGPGPVDDGAELAGRVMWGWCDRLGIPDLGFEIRTRAAGWLAAGEWAGQPAAADLMPGCTDFSLDVLISPGGIDKDPALLRQLPEDGGEAVVTTRMLVEGTDLASLLDHLPEVLQQVGATTVEVAPTSDGGWWVEMEHPASAVPAEGLPGCVDLFAFAHVCDEDTGGDEFVPETLEVEPLTMSDAESQDLVEAIEEYRRNQARVVVVLTSTSVGESSGSAEERTRQLACGLGDEVLVHSPIHQADGSWLTHAHLLIGDPTDSPRAIAAELTAELGGIWGPLSPHLASGHVYRVWHAESLPRQGFSRLSLHVVTIAAYSIEALQRRPAADESELFEAWLRGLR